MKKICSFLAASALLWSFSACDDVPAPYEVDDTPGGDDVVENVIFSEDFSQGQGDFTFNNVNLSDGLSYVWKATSYNSSFYLIASAYAGGASHASESWAISPAINLSDCTTATLTFSHAINKIGEENLDRMQDMMTVWVSTDYAGDATAANWQQVTIPNYPGGTSWTFVESGKVKLDDFCGNSTVFVGFRYMSEDGISGSWEVSNFVVKGDGTPMETGGEGGGEAGGDEPQPSGENLLKNGDFESWTSGKADNWDGVVGNATVSQSTDAHTGTYSIAVNGASSNKRLAYHALRLKAGSYTLSFYLKAATADGGSVRPGYTILTNGSVANTQTDYVYGDYVNGLTNTAWTTGSYSFQLESDTVVNLVLMNPKSTATQILVDDVTLTTTNGAVLSYEPYGQGGGSEEPVTPPASDGTFVKTTTVADGTYLIGALVDGVYKLGTAYDASKTYGYIQVVDATAANDQITTATANEAFTIKAVEGGYTLQDASGRYIYMTGTYNSFNLNAALPEEGGVWTITFNADGTANVVNATTGKTLQYSVEYSSYGAYANVTNVLPTLFVKK